MNQTMQMPFRDAIQLVFRSVRDGKMDVAATVLQAIDNQIQALATDRDSIKAAFEIFRGNKETEDRMLAAMIRDALGCEEERSLQTLVVELCQDALASDTLLRTLGTDFEIYGPKPLVDIVGEIRTRVRKLREKSLDELVAVSEELGLYEEANSE